MSDKHYKNIKEVSKILNLKEHVIRHWDSIDPKTQKLRIQGLSIRSKGGTRYFNKENIKKLEQIKNLLFENGKHNYSLDLANKILSSRKNKVLNNKINLRIPIVLFHGTNDEVVPLNISKKILKVCKKSKKKLIKIKNGDHSLSRKSDLKKICKELYQMVLVI